MTNQIIELTKHTRLWRYDGDPTGFNISDSNLRLFNQVVWVDESNNNEIYQLTNSYMPVVDSITNLNLLDEFQAIQDKITPLILANIQFPEEENLPIGLKRTFRIWRYQGEVQNGDINTTVLECWLHSVLVDESNNIYNPESLPTFQGNIQDLGILEEFQSIQLKLGAVLSGEPEIKTIELEPVLEIWRYQSGTIAEGNLSNADLEAFAKKGLRDIATGELYQVEDLPKLIVTPENLGVLQEIGTIQSKLQILFESQLSESENAE